MLEVIVLRFLTRILNAAVLTSGLFAQAIRNMLRQSTHGLSAFFITCNLLPLTQSTVQMAMLRGSDGHVFLASGVFITLLRSGPLLGYLINLIQIWLYEKRKSSLIALGLFLFTALMSATGDPMARPSMNTNLALYYTLRSLAPTIGLLYQAYLLRSTKRKSVVSPFLFGGLTCYYGIELLWRTQLSPAFTAWTDTVAYHLPLMVPLLLSAALLYKTSKEGFSLN